MFETGEWRFFFKGAFPAGADRELQGAYPLWVSRGAIGGHISLPASWQSRKSAVLYVVVMSEGSSEGALRLLCLLLSSHSHNLSDTYRFRPLAYRSGYQPSGIRRQSTLIPIRQQNPKGFLSLNDAGLSAPKYFVELSMTYFLLRGQLPSDLWSAVVEGPSESGRVGIAQFLFFWSGGHGEEGELIFAHRTS